MTFTLLEWELTETDKSPDYNSVNRGSMGLKDPPNSYLPGANMYLYIMH